MPIGTKVTAARAGVVADVRANFRDGQHGLREANWVKIRHEDSTIAAYSHLTKNDMYLSPYDGHSGRRGYQIQADTIFENIKIYVQRVGSRGATEGRP